MKRASEGDFGKALRDVDLPIYVYRLPDPKTGAGVSNWKPCDFMVWTNPNQESPFVRSDWFEAKDTDAVNAFPFADLRPSQAAGIREATRLGIPYWLAIYWRRAKVWSISDAAKVIGWFGLNIDATSIDRQLLMSRYGVDSTTSRLADTLKSVLLGEV